MRKMLSLIILTLFVISVFSITSEAVQYQDHRNLRVTDYAITNNQLDKSGSPSVALGAYSADGGSPGYIIGRSWRDDLAHLSPGHFVGWRGNSTPQIHFAYNQQGGCGGYPNPPACAHWHHYNMYEPTTGVFVLGAIGIQATPSFWIEGGQMSQMEVDETGHVIIIGEVMEVAAGEDAANYVKFFWDIDPEGWGTFLFDTLPIEEVVDKSLWYRQPRIAYQEYDGNYVMHVVSLNDVGFGGTNSTREMYYYRKVAATAGPDGTWDPPLLITDSVWSNHYAFGVAQDNSGVISLVWIGYYGQSGPEPIWVMKSTDAGASWAEKINVVDPEDDYQPWIECDAMVDSDGYTHVIYPAMGSRDDRIIHWTDRVAGPVAGGKTSIIDILTMDLDVMCGFFGYNMLTIGKPMLSECNDRIYATWIIAGDPENGDSTDCSDPEAGLKPQGSGNADIVMAISSSLDGSLWDLRRNLTNSKSPGCDGTDADPCDHDNYPSTARVGMNTHPSVVGTTFWTNAAEAFEVRDALDGSYPDTGYFIDLQYINDIFPGISRYNDDILWTDNPIKWFRLPCVPPIIEPRIFMPAPFQHPKDWVKGGEQYDLDMEVLNLGNALLTITNIETAITEGSGWLTLHTTSMTIPAASSGLVSMTLNPGLIDPAPGSPYGIEAWIIFTSDDDNHGIDSAQIRTVIADSVAAQDYEVVITGHGISLAVLNNGNAGNWVAENGVGFMAFEDTLTGLHEDCDSLEDVYVFEVSPVVMFDVDNYGWNGYYDIEDPIPEHNFVPVQSIAPTICLRDNMMGYNTGVFVNADSTIGMIKTWGAPADDVTYIIEKWEIFSYDGATHSAVNIGEWVDIDVPSDSGVDNIGFVMEDDDYVYVTGLEGLDDPEDCIDNDTRFYMTGMLGFYNVSELAGNPAINHTGMEGGYVVLRGEFATAGGSLVADSAWSFFGKNLYNANNTESEDQRTFLDIGMFDITTDTLVVWIVHGTLYDKTVADVEAQNAAAKVWYAAHRSEFGLCNCCGIFTGGYPGNTTCDVDGKRNLADITKLIDHVYISKNDLCCNENGNVTSDLAGKRNLADITKLIDNVYISKNEVLPCL